MVFGRNPNKQKVAIHLKNQNGDDKHISKKHGWGLFNRNKQGTEPVIKKIQDDAESIGQFKMFPEGSKPFSDLIVKIDEAEMHGGIPSGDKKLIIGFKNLSDADKKWWEEKYHKVGLDFTTTLKQLENKTKI